MEHAMKHKNLIYEETKKDKYKGKVSTNAATTKSAT